MFTQEQWWESTEFLRKSDREADKLIWRRTLAPSLKGSGVQTVFLSAFIHLYSGFRSVCVCVCVFQQDRLHVGAGTLDSGEGLCYSFQLPGQGMPMPEESLRLSIEWPVCRQRRPPLTCPRLKKTTAHCVCSFLLSGSWTATSTDHPFQMLLSNDPGIYLYFAVPLCLCEVNFHSMFRS